MYAIELTGLYIGEELEWQRWGKKGGKPFLYTENFTPDKIEHNGSTVRLTKSTRVKNYYGYHITYKYKSLKMDAEVWIKGEKRGL